MERFETLGSVWLIDGDRYMRMPKDEKPRRADHSVGAMADLTWHPMDRYEIDGLRARLRIFIEPDSELHISAPLTWDETERLGL